eukprot:5360943-Alexandrium_andersonii.AAC.1
MHHEPLACGVEVLELAQLSCNSMEPGGRLRSLQRQAMNKDPCAVAVDSANATVDLDGLRAPIRRPAVFCQLPRRI